MVLGSGEQVVLRLKVSLARFERATSCLEGSCSIQLSYRDQSSTHNLTSREYKVKAIMDSSAVGWSTGIGFVILIGDRMSAIIDRGFNKGAVK